MKTLFALLSACSLICAQAETFVAASAAMLDVSNAVQLASNGDTVTVPSGNVAWTGPGLTIAKAITISGAGPGLTQISNNTATANDSVITLTLVANRNTKLNGISFVGGTASGPNYGVVRFDGSYSDARRGILENCTFTNTLGRTAVFIVGAFGVTSGCSFSMSGNQFSHDVWGTDDGDADFAAATDFGTEKFWFIETCTYTNTGSLYEMIDSASGGRWVLRYCNGFKSRISTHGSDSTSNRRGTRAIEIYRNYFIGDNSASVLLALRSGCAVIHGNVITNWNGNTVWGLSAFRSVDRLFTPWGGANGTNGWDVNSGSNPFESNTSSSGGTLTMTRTGAGWTVDQWVGYTLRNVTSNMHSTITANTSDTITYRAGNGYEANMSFVAGNAYNINLVTSILDQPGLGIGTLISSGAAATNPNAAIDPIYEWSNAVDGDATAYSVAAPTIVSNTHYKVATAMPGYSAYPYPHPLVVQNNTPSGPSIRGILLQ